MGSSAAEAVRINLQEVANRISEVARRVELVNGSEEDLKVGVEKVLEQSVWRELGIPPPRYEYPLKGLRGAVVKHYRVDAIYGLTIFEYKVPGTLGRVGERERAVEKLRSEYIPALLNDSEVKKIIEEIRAEKLSPRIAGVLLDGYNILFIYYNVDTGEFNVDPPDKPYSVDSESIRKLISIVLASYKKRLDAKALASVFGFHSSVAQKAVRTFYNALQSPHSEKTYTFFEEWKKNISYAYPLSGEELRKIALNYGFSREEVEKIDGVKLFYAIQTYYAFILKLIAAEVVARFYDSSANFYIQRLRRKDLDLKQELANLESGFVYKWRGIKNFLEGELFGWYIEEWSKEISEAVRLVIEKLDEFDAETLAHDLSAARDVFKILYEELVPREEVRRYLGIYTTPDWLAELILDELGLNENGLAEMETKGINPLDIKILDPGVGTGTFLSLVIQRLAFYLNKKYKGKIDADIARNALLSITRNVIGFDIDALALLTAKTNYILALKATGLLDHKGNEEIEIPIYMVNSILTVEELKDKLTEKVDEHGKYVYVEVVKIPTAVGEFILPLKFVETVNIDEFLLEIALLLQRDLPSNNPQVQETFRKYIAGDLEENEVKAWLSILGRFYDSLLELKSKGNDSFWINRIRDYFISKKFKGKFDYIVGNPPWIVYRNLTNPLYQEKIKDLVTKHYRLVTEEHLITHLELATLFFVRSMDLYLKDNGRIGFVLPRSIFSSDQHDKIRKGKVENPIRTLRIEYRILKIIDCEDVEPLFYVPACALIAVKGNNTSYPVDAIVVRGRLPRERHKIIPLRDALKDGYLTHTTEKLYLNTLGSRTWLDYKLLKIPQEKSYYYKYFKQGATIVPQACWFVDIIEKHENQVIVTTGRRVKLRGKLEIEIPPLPVETSFIYGVLTSAEVMPFCHLPPTIAVLPLLAPTKRKQEEETLSRSFQLLTREMALEKGFYNLANWLKKTEEVWNQSRGLKLAKASIYEWLDWQHKLSSQDPSAKYRVVYLRSGTNLAATVVDMNKILKENPLLNGVIIESTLYHYETKNLDEAYYLAAFLNSNVLDELIKPMQSKGEFGERDIHKKPLEFPIEKFNSKKTIHKKLSSLGEKATSEAFNLLPIVLANHGYDKKLEERGVLMPQEVATVRRDIRSRLKDIIEEIDDLVREILLNNDDPSLDLFLNQG